MAKVITFSRTFPAYHSKKGQPTFFLEMVQGSLYNLGVDLKDFIKHPDIHMSNNMWNKSPKNHTIRSGNRWKAGDYFSPRVWGNNINPKNGRSGPYHSNQITFAPDTLIVKTWDFEICGGEFKINDKVYNGESEAIFEKLEEVAKNDGLDRHDLLEWFKYPKPFKGQIICWNESVSY